MSAIISDCGQHRHRLDRWVTNSCGTLTFAYFGVNPGMAGPVVNDHTVTKLGEFTRRHGGNHFVIGNAFTYRATDVKELRDATPNHGDADRFLDEIIAEADILVPMWGRTNKVPAPLRPRFDEMALKVMAAGKPVKIFGLTAGGDPKHPLMLPYDTPLIDWSRP
ncbi:DUF1643 domain-containing protein [Burkholderia vietnamiensis]|uniref:DUF1643 domain-containing protein n=1 Tax=Burkholderia vietnamiensis TaxID=60552 RepID=UPI001B9AF152|nr:DUF1643 domain-containing protein [Burkholderia vietnamiensis]MBR8054205.1 DUF1643 domain-containing protein [Burkholderia vietnamiensis]